MTGATRKASPNMYSVNNAVNISAEFGKYTLDKDKKDVLGLIEKIKNTKI